MKMDENYANAMREFYINVNVESRRIWQTQTRYQ